MTTIFFWLEGSNNLSWLATSNWCVYIVGVYVDNAYYVSCFSRVIFMAGSTGTLMSSRASNMWDKKEVSEGSRRKACSSYNWKKKQESKTYSNDVYVDYCTTFVLLLPTLFLCLALRPSHHTTMLGEAFEVKQGPRTKQAKTMYHHPGWLRPPGVTSSGPFYLLLG